jgi:Late competence development protein ComFB
MELIRNHQERLVIDLVRSSATRYPGIAADPNLLADVACLALNLLKPRYFRHEVDLHFYMGAEERARNAAALKAAVEAAFEQISGRADTAPREAVARRP